MHLLTALLIPCLIKRSDGLANRFDRAAPQWLADHLALDSRWVVRLREQQSEDPNIYRSLRWWVLPMSLNLVLVAALLITTAWMHRRGIPDWLTLPNWTGDPRSVRWLGTIVLALPLVIATLRKLRALALVIAELSVRDEMAEKNTRPIHAVVTNTILGCGAGFTAAL